MRWKIASTGGRSRTPRLVRWPIVVGVLLFAGSFAVAVASCGTPTSSPVSVPYVLTATDAHFTATFPRKPQRHHVGTHGIVYAAGTSDHVVEVLYFPAPGSFSLDRVINSIAGDTADFPGGKLVSHRMLIDQGQPAEDAVISFSHGLARVRAVRLGSSGYVFIGDGRTASVLAHDYNVLLDSFRPLHP